MVVFQEKICLGILSFISLTSLVHSQPQREQITTKISEYHQIWVIP